MPTCPKCKHEWVDVTWRDYLKKQPGHKVHFFSNESKDTEPEVRRTRLHFKLDTDKAVIRAALELIQIEHRTDPFFRWCDTAEGTIDSIIMRL
jgi:hypothetical protein